MTVHRLVYLIKNSIIIEFRIGQKSGQQFSSIRRPFQRNFSHRFQQNKNLPHIRSVSQRVSGIIIIILKHLTFRRSVFHFLLGNQFQSCFYRSSNVAVYFVVRNSCQHIRILRIANQFKFIQTDRIIQFSWDIKCFRIVCNHIPIVVPPEIIRFFGISSSIIERILMCDHILIDW
ncbi:hypothetical protein D3C80_971310 [compost metagenome]